MKVGLTPVCRISYHQLTPNWWLLCAFVLLKIISPGITLAQSKIWDKTIGTNSYEYLSSLQQTSDGGYILGGSSGSGINGDKTEANKGEFDDYWIVKLKADGTKEWDKTIGSGSSDDLNSLQQTSDGGYILGGTSGSDISGDKSEDRIGGCDEGVL